MRAHLLRRGLLVVLVAAMTLPVSSCFLRSVLGGEIIEDFSEGVQRVIDRVKADATTSVCRPDLTDPSIIECDYIIEGQPLTSTTRLISELGIFGVIIDPIVLALPDDAENFVGTWEDGSGNVGDLWIYPQLSVVPVDDDRSIVAGAGEQLVIVELPTGLPVDMVDYEFDVSWERFVEPGTPPTQIRALFTARAEFRGKAYYPPLYPCTTDMTTIPPVTLPVVADENSLEAITLSTSEATCAAENYFFFFAESLAEPCDVDNNQIVDQDDITMIMDARNVPTSPGDPRDANGDGRIDANDARACTLECLFPLCATL